ncbi:MAG TPA: response regulator, partial [Blastocatellia bacterium]|nr:response regulator [Blastocatellia bacterium]
MAGNAPNLIASGIEPVDKLLGGLESGQLYLVHGEASGKSLFGIKFLIEGLKRGENGALVIRYSPEDAVRRFARLGYDCLEDVYSGRLVILEYSNEIIQQIARLRAITPVLRELEWLLGETRPQRLIFDPVTYLVVGEEGDPAARVQEFAQWAGSFGATVALVADGEDDYVVSDFLPLVRESFRFEVRDVNDRATRFFAFEKTRRLPDQPIEVDPSRGVFLLTRVPAQEPAAPTPRVEESEKAAPKPEFFTRPKAEPNRPAGMSFGTVEAWQSSNPLDELEDDSPLADLWRSRDDVEPRIEEDRRANIRIASNPETPRGPANDKTGTGAFAKQGIATPRDDEPDKAKASSDTLSQLLDQFAGPAPPVNFTALDEVFVDLDATRKSAERNRPPTEEPGAVRPFPVEGSPLKKLEADSEAGQVSGLGDFPSKQDRIVLQRGAEGSTRASVTETRQGAPKPDVDTSVAARAADFLLRPPNEAGEPAQHLAADARIPTEVNAGEFRVLVIDDDAATCDSIAQALGEYTIEVVHDGISGLAKLISIKPDLVILNLDLPIIDGFKILGHIRSSLNMPIIVLSGSRMRASDRLLSTELGADYYLTKPFSLKELRQKARQLIARHRGISSWIITSQPADQGQPVCAPGRIAPTERRTTKTTGSPSIGASTQGEYFIGYADFVARVEKGVKATMGGGSSFSIVGCRVPEMTARGGRIAVRLLELVKSLVRDTDVISTNPRNDIVVLLAEADAVGARAFVSRLR